MILRRLPLLCVLVVIASGCGPKKTADTPPPPATTGTTATTGGATTTGGTKPAEPVFLKDLVKNDIKVGTGPGAAPGDLCIVKYDGKFKNGERFDNSGPGGYAITLGESQVIEGWHKGIEGMQEGGVRKLEIPARMAYGQSGQGQIPPNTDLYFDVTLLGLVKKGKELVMIPDDVKKGSGKPVGEGDIVTINARTHLIDGTPVYDSGKEPQTFKIGEGKAYEHIEEGVKGMRVGGVRKLRVPPAAGFGQTAKGFKIPPNSILLYRIEMVKVKYGK